MAVAADAPAGVPARYELMLPPGWTRLPLRAGTDRAISAVLDEQFAGLGRDRAFPLRRALAEDLHDLVADARRVGGLDLYLMTSAPGGQPVDASLLVCLVSGRAGGEPASAEDLLAVLGSPGDGDTSVRALPLAGPSVRRVSTRHPHPSDDLPVPTPVTRVQYLVPVPGSTAQLLLTFATTTQPVVGQLTILFDAMAESLGFR